MVIIVKVKRRGINYLPSRKKKEKVAALVLLWRGDVISHCCWNLNLCLNLYRYITPANFIDYSFIK